MSSLCGPRMSGKRRRSAAMISVVSSTESVVCVMYASFSSGAVSSRSTSAADSVATLPAVWRSRSRATAGDVTVLAIFPAVAVIAALYGVIVADRQTPVQDHLWLSFAAMVVALAPALFFFGRLVRAGLVSGGDRVRAAEARTTELDRELTAVTELATALVRAKTAEAVDRTLIDEAAKVLGVEFGALVVVNDGVVVATGLVARY